jgi:transcriptional regulator NrdR family protein
MKCPKCKKPSDLYTKKTLANGREVVRHRFCRKCKGRFVTIERFDTNIAEVESQYERRIQKTEIDNQSLESQIEGYRDLFKVFKQTMDRANAKR